MGTAPSQQRNYVISVVFDSVNQWRPVESKTRVQQKILVKSIIIYNIISAIVLYYIITSSQSRPSGISLDLYNYYEWRVEGGLVVYIRDVHNINLYNVLKM